LVLVGVIDAVLVEMALGEGNCRGYDHRSQ